jgi:hypothetical protein
MDPLIDLGNRLDTVRVAARLVRSEEKARKQAWELLEAILQ